MKSALTFQMVVIRFMTFNRYKQTLVQQLVTTVTVFHSLSNTHVNDLSPMVLYC